MWLCPYYTMTTKKEDPVEYVSENRGNKNIEAFESIDNYLHKKNVFEGRHLICHICGEIDLRWCVVRQGLRVCSECVGKRGAFYLKMEEYRRLKLIK